jgi:uncharacterized protein YigE (DUF2233 family)
MAKFKEKPKMSSTAGIGQNFRKIEVSNSSRSKKIILIIASILIGTLFICFLISKNGSLINDQNNQATTIPEYSSNDNKYGSDGNLYSVFKVKLNKDLQHRIYVEQNLSKRNIKSLLNKISRDKLGKTSVQRSLFYKEDQFFAITAAMFDDDNLPPGLLISNSKKYKNLNLNDGNGNFYLKPNGVLSISENNEVSIQESDRFDITNQYSFAIQSGPMLIIDNKINDAFPNDSKNVNIRSAVGLNDKELVFVISKSPINFFQLAEFLKNDLKCINAIHLESAGFAFMEFPGSSFKNTFKSDTELRNLLIIR